MPDEQRQAMLQKYMKVLDKQIPEDNYSKEKGIEVVVKDQTFIANRYTLKLTGDELINVKIKLLEELLNDEEILNEIVKMLQKEDKYIKIIKTNIQEEIEKIRRQPSNQNIAIELSAFEVNDELIKTECRTDISMITIENIIGKNAQNVKITNTQTDKGIIVNTYSFMRNTADDINSLVINLNTTENGREASDLVIIMKNEGNIKSDKIDSFININLKNDLGKYAIEYMDKKQFNVSSEIPNLSEDTVTLNNMKVEYNRSTIEAIKERLKNIYSERAESVGLNSDILTLEIKLAIKKIKEQFNRDEFEKQIQRSLNYIKQDAEVDNEYKLKLENARTSEEKQRLKEERLVKRLVEFGIDARTDEDTGRILIDSGYEYNYVYYIDYDKYTVTRAE